MQRPLLSSNTYINNTALYGSNIASYPVKIVQQGTTNNKIYIDGVGSGILYPNALTFEVIDKDNQVMNLIDGYTVNIETMSTDYRVRGTTTAMINKGIATFNDLIFISEPGSTDIIYEITSKILDSEQIKNGLGLTTETEKEYENDLFVTFRQCKPGEIEQSNECRECSLGSYSLEWGSTECHNCMNQAD